MQKQTSWIAVAALVISFASAFFAFWSNIIAKRSLRLSKEQAKARLPNLVPYLIDGLARRLDERKTKLYAFSLSLSNRSDSDNSLSIIELRFFFTRSSGISSNIIIPHNSNLSENLGLEGTEPLIIPVHISAHGTVTGWAFFEIDESIINDVSIERYEIRLIDAHGNEINLEPVILREVIDEEAK